MPFTPADCSEKKLFEGEKECGKKYKLTLGLLRKEVTVN